MPMERRLWGLKFRWATPVASAVLLALLLALAACQSDAGNAPPTSRTVAVPGVDRTPASAAPRRIQATDASRLLPLPLPTATPDLAAALPPTSAPQPTATPRPVVALPPTSAPRPTATPRPAAALPPTSTPRPTATPRPAAGRKPTSLAAMHNTNNAQWVAQRHPGLHRAMMQLPWVADGLDDGEKEAIDSILYAAVRDSSIAENLVQMPFLFSYEPADVHAIDGIREMMRDGFSANLTSSRVFRNGITDEWAPVVAAAGTLGSGAAISQYLNDAAITVDSREYTMSGQPLAITIVRPDNAAAQPGTMEMAYQSVIGVEAVMRLPLPVRHVIIAFDPRAVSADSIGTNHGYAIGISEENPNGGQASLRNTLFHEVAHYWWGGNVNWIDEGMADTIAATASLAAGDDWEARPNRRKECAARNISVLGHSRRGDGQFHCNYYLGEMLFRDLQAAMTPADFTAAIQALYFASRAKPAPQSADEYRADIAEVRQAFPEQRDIIDRHYNGDLNAPHRWDPDDAINLRHHDAVIWEQKPTYHNGIVSFSGRLTGAATLVSRNITEARQGGTATFTVGAGAQSLGSILPGLPGNSYWTLDDPADAVAEVFELDGGAFSVSFQWPAAAGEPIGKRISVWGYIDSGRTPVWGRRADSLGISLIR